MSATRAEPTFAYGDTADVARLLRDARIVARLVNLALQEDGLRDDLWRAMHELHRSHGLSMTQLSDATALPSATTTRLVDELSDMGAVFRRPSPEDGRKAIVYLSQDGELRLRRANAVIQARLDLAPAAAS